MSIVELPGTPLAGPASAQAGTTAMQVAADLRHRIVQGELRPGQRLKIDEIAASCNVSHMPVRGALQELESEGVLDLFPHRGAVIRSVDAHFVRNMLALRGAIEVMLAEHCARMIDDDGLARIEALIVQHEAAVARADTSAIVQANLRLHDTINQVADNPEAMRTLGRGRLLIHALRVRYGYGPGRIETVMREHRALLRAIARQDETRAAEITRKHCEGASRELLSLLR